MGGSKELVPLMMSNDAEPHDNGQDRTKRSLSLR